MERSLRWDDIRFFYIAAEEKSLRAAAQKLGCSPATVAARINALEAQTGRVLLARSNDGVRLTLDGEALLRTAQKMKEASLSADYLIRNRQIELGGTVRVAVTEGLGAFWIAPRLVEFRNRHQNVLVDLRCDMNLPDLMRYESDIAIQLSPPSQRDVIAKRVGYMHVMPFASLEYLRKRGTPKSLQDWPNHNFVEQIAEQVPTSNMNKYFSDDVQGQFVGMRTNTSTAHYWAVAKGAGIGILPTYIRAISAKVVPIDIGVQFQREIWLVTHPDTRNIKRVAAVKTWLEESFDPNLYPWFGKKFIHPKDLGERIHEAVRTQLFEGFIEQNRD